MALDQVLGWTFADLTMHYFGDAAKAYSNDRLGTFLNLFLNAKRNYSVVQAVLQHEAIQQGELERFLLVYAPHYSEFRHKDLAIILDLRLYPA